VSLKTDWTRKLNGRARLQHPAVRHRGVLRSRFTIRWKVDRGTNPDGSERVSDPHKTRAAKLAARM